MKTNKPLHISINRITTIFVPAGAEIEKIPGGFGGNGDGFAIKNPLNYIDKDDTLARWDAQHHYFWVDPKDFE